MLKSPVLRLSYAVFTLMTAPALFAATPEEEISSFSALPPLDLGALAKGKIEVKSQTELDINRGMAVQSAYVINAPMDRVLATLSAWDGTKHGDTKVILHREITSPAPTSFEAVRQISEGDFKGLTRFTETLPKPTSMLNLSDSEAKSFSPPEKSAMDSYVRDFWIKILSQRCQAFVAGGISAQPSYDSGMKPVSPGKDLRTLLSAEPKVQKQFSSLIGASGMSGGGRAALYWEMVDAEIDSLVLGAYYSSKISEKSVQALDLQYYVSSGYYTLITLQQLWAIEIEGKPATLIWRGDLLSAPSLEGLRSTERMGSGRALRREIEKTIQSFRKAF